MDMNFKTYLNKKAGITDEQFHQLSNFLGSKQLEKGHLLLRAGEICEHVFFVEKGLLRAFTIDDLGKEHVVQFASEGWFISERNSLLFNEPSIFFIDVIERTQVVAMERDFSRITCDISPSFAVFNETLLNNHIRHLQKRVVMMLSATAEARYRYFLEQYPDLTKRVPQWMIASYLGIAPESLSRVRKDMSKKNT
jgi:CRP-like cAMP-binding protein